MNNNELLQKMYNELESTYQLGLHAVNKGHYDFRVNDFFEAESYFIDKDNVTELDIIYKILKEGLKIREKCIGLVSTVNFFGNIDSLSPDVFNYTYGGNYNNKAFIIVVAIPKYISIKGREYFIGETSGYNDVNIANFSLFYSMLPKEFIYGYYVKKYTRTDEGKIVFNDDLDFYANLGFYHFISNKEDFWLDFLEKNKLNLSLLNAVNYPNFFNNLFQNSRNRHAIRMTKQQIKKLKK